MSSRVQSLVTTDGRAPRVLIVARGFPPLAGPTEYRWLRFVRHLATHGWRVDILTVRPVPRSHYYDEKLLDLIPASVTVHRVYPGPYERLIIPGQMRTLAEMQKRIAAGQSADSLTLRERIRRALGNVDRALAPLKIPDDTFDWVPFAIAKAARLLAVKHYDVLVSSSCPFSSHMVGWWLKRRYGLPWVGDFSDPYVFGPFVRRPSWRLALDRRLEQAWLDSMDAVVFPVHEMVDGYLSYYPSLDRSKVHLIPYGYAEELYESVQPEQAEGFCIVHTGWFYADIRDPTNFFAALQRLRDLPIRVVHAGGLAPHFQEHLVQSDLLAVVQNLGFVSKTRVAALQMGATVAMLIGKRGGYQLPGKLFDYIAARRPILMIKNDQHDISANMVARLSRGLVVENEPDAIAAGIRQLYAWWQEGTLDGHFDLSQSDDYSWAAQCDKMARVLTAQLEK